LLRDIPKDKVKEFESEYIQFLEMKQRKTLDSLRDGVLNPEIEKILEQVAHEIASKYK
jgi:F-type H+-transporting ATPase subunit alpha